MGATLLGMVLMLVVMRFSQKYFVKQQMALGDVNGHVEEMYSGHTVVKAFGGEADAIRRFERYNNDLYDSGWKSQFISGLMMPMMNL
ncbi:ABC transporter transmembrane domain-containing protein, partial [Stenotrophomonas maltophilia]|uniref:ABC transporter transmembrane domain-containing protein n=1 Tax=Stenotrophomonas maltophilia TaxID=40324 RepID=UPI0023BAB2FC